MQQPDVDSNLNAIERKDFLAPTYIASGYNTVADIVSQMPEVKFLLDHKSSSLPLMRARYRDRGGSMPDAVRLVYFVVFGLLHDKEVIPDIILYLRGCRDLPSGTLLSPWHPFLHGIQALSEITNHQIQAPGSSEILRLHEEFLTSVENWAK